MALVSYLKPTASTKRVAASPPRRRMAGAPQRFGNGRYAAAGIALTVVVIAAALIVLSSSGASLTSDSDALARVGMPLGGGTITSVSVTAGPRGALVPVQVRNDGLYPTKLVPAHTLVSIQVTVKRPGWISWLSGSTEKLHLTLMTPSASLIQHFLTLSSGAPLRLQFRQPIQVVSYGPSASSQQRHVLARSLTQITLPRTASAGSVWIAAAPHRWESSKPTVVSWFPAGAAAAAVASPGPGSTIGPTTPISLTFSKPVSQALGSSMPPVNPITPGTWHQQNDHTIVFEPEGYGYGLGSTVNIPLPAGVQLVGANGGSNSANWSVPSGSTMRLQQLLSLLGYLPLRFHYSGGSGVALTLQAQEAAALNPPRGHFSWRYPNIPGALRSMWQPGTSGTMTRGAVMAFENDHGLNDDGVASAAVWKQLIQSVISRQGSTFGYTFVTVSEGSPETESTWHNGKVVVSGLVNTGIPGAATATGVYPVFEHALSVTMSGTNPDGSTYSDPGVPYVSYFNGGDALHGFLRGSYGSAQSLGCVEMPYDEASSVYPYTPVGTLVNVVS